MCRPSDPHPARQRRASLRRGAGHRHPDDVCFGRREGILARRRAKRVRTLVAQRERNRRMRGNGQNEAAGTPEPHLHAPPAHWFTPGFVPSSLMTVTNDRPLTLPPGAAPRGGARAAAVETNAMLCARTPLVVSLCDLDRPVVVADAPGPQVDQPPVGEAAIPASGCRR